MKKEEVKEEVEKVPEEVEEVSKKLAEEVYRNKKIKMWLYRI